MKTEKNRADCWVSSPHLQRWMVPLCIVLFAALCLSGCRKHICAICGQEAKEKITIAGKEFHICENCYKVYIEEEHLFDEKL